MESKLLKSSKNAHDIHITEQLDDQMKIETIFIYNL